MPDHLHWLMQLADEPDLSATVRLYKAKVSACCGGSIWQKGFHGRAVRREEDLRVVARYVIANPLRAGLVERVGDYPHWDAVWLEDNPAGLQPWTWPRRSPAAPGEALPHRGARTDGSPNELGS